MKMQSGVRNICALTLREEVADGRDLGPPDLIGPLN
jgi:hypothetical protein